MRHLFTPLNRTFYAGGFMAMNTVNLKLLSLSTQTQFLQAEKCERLPSNYFDPTVRKQHAVRVAILLVNCLNSYGHLSKLIFRSVFYQNGIFV